MLMDEWYSITALYDTYTFLLSFLHKQQESYKKFKNLLHSDDKSSSYASSFYNR